MIINIINRVLKNDYRWSSLECDQPQALFLQNENRITKFLQERVQCDRSLQPFVLSIGELPIRNNQVRKRSLLLVHENSRKSTQTYRPVVESETGQELPKSFVTNRLESAVLVSFHHPQMQTKIDKTSPNDNPDA